MEFIIPQSSEEKYISNVNGIDCVRLDDVLYNLDTAEKLMTKTRGLFLLYNKNFIHSYRNSQSSGSSACVTDYFDQYGNTTV